MTKFGRMNAQPPAQAPPETAAQIGDKDADLDRERSGQRLANGDGLAHLLFGEPLFVVDEFALHLANQCDRSAEAEKAQSQKVADQFAHPTAFTCRYCRRHSLAPSILICGFEDPVERKPESRWHQFDTLALESHRVAAVIVLTKPQAQVVFFDRPPSDLLGAQNVRILRSPGFVSSSCSRSCRALRVGLLRA